VVDPRGGRTRTSRVKGRRRPDMQHRNGWQGGIKNGKEQKVQDPVGKGLTHQQQGRKRRVFARPGQEKSPKITRGVVSVRDKQKKANQTLKGLGELKQAKIWGKRDSVSGMELGKKKNVQGAEIGGKKKQKNAVGERKKRGGTC